VSSGALGEIQCIWKQQDDASLIDKRCHDRTHVARQLSCMSVRLVQNSSKVSRVRKYIMQVRFPKIGVPQIIQVMNDHFGVSSHSFRIPNKFRPRHPYNVRPPR
jgi:hypothetical protein